MKQGTTGRTETKLKNKIDKNQNSLKTNMKDILINRGALILLGLTVVSYFILLLNDNLSTVNYFIFIPVLLSIYIAPYFFDGKNYRAQNFHYLMLYLFVLSTFGKFINTFIIDEMWIKIMLNLGLAIFFLSIYYFRIKYFQSKVI
jgi:hypothetical protein